MLWQHDFWMKPKNFVVQYPHRQQSMNVTIPGTLCSNILIIEHKQYSTFQILRLLDSNQIYLAS